MAKKQKNNTEQVVDIDTLRQDMHNFNRGTDYGQQLMERSFKELGAGRSILLDREGNIIAGNKSQEAARKAGIVEQARLYILTDCGGSFERFAEWGLLRP